MLNLKQAKHIVHTVYGDTHYIYNGFDLGDVFAFMVLPNEQKHHNHTSVYDAVNKRTGEMTFLQASFHTDRFDNGTPISKEDLKFEPITAGGRS